jgi:hypothetical protein
MSGLSATRPIPIESAPNMCNVALSTFRMSAGSMQHCTGNLAIISETAELTLKKGARRM